MLENFKVGCKIKCLKTDYWDDSRVHFQTKGNIYLIEGEAVNGNPYFVGDCGGRIYIDEETANDYELLSKFANNTSTVTHEFTYPKINLIGSQVHGENFYNDDTYFSFEFKYKGDGDVLFDELSSLQADIVKLLSEKYQ